MTSTAHIPSSVVVVLVLAGFPFVPGALAESRPDTIEAILAPAHVPGEVLVGLKSRASEIAVGSPDRQEFVPSVSALDIPPHPWGDVTITFTPAADEVVDKLLTLASNDPDGPGVIVALHGEGFIPPEIDVSPTSLAADLLSNQKETQTLTILNTGGGDLRFEARSDPPSTSRIVDVSPPFPSSPIVGADEVLLSARPDRPADEMIHSAPGPEPSGTSTVAETPAKSLEDVLASIDFGFAGVTGAIPDRFDFSEGETGTSIIDGGNNMYDGGNSLSTNLGSAVPYSNGTVSSHGAFGTTGRYFTRKYPGLFVLAADLDWVSSFTIDGYLGAGGWGYAGGATFETNIGGSWYRGFVKRVYYAGVPSVNHLVIVPYDAAVNHEFFSHTRYDYHRVFGLFGTRRLYYLLYASASGGYIDNDQTLALMESFLRAIYQPWLGVEPSDGVIPAGGRADLTVTFDATDRDGGDYDTNIVIASNDPDEPEVVVPAHLRVASVPDIAVEGVPVSLESLATYASRGATTSHRFELRFPPLGEGLLELIADGPYQFHDQTATVVVEGRVLASVGNTNQSCGPARGTFRIGADELTDLASDGVVQVEIRNSYEVDARCPTHTHRVRLNYQGSASPMDFGSLFLDRSRSLVLRIANKGTDTLAVSSIASDRPEFAPSVSALSIPPRQWADVTITFTASAAEVVDGALIVASNDPDEPRVTVALHGEGLIPPDIDVTPDALAVALGTGLTLTRTLTIINTGGSDLKFVASTAGPVTSRIDDVSPSFASSPAADDDEVVRSQIPGPPDADMIRTATLPEPSGTSTIAAAPERGLEDVLRSMDFSISGVTGAIPNRFDFTEGEIGRSIANGGNDMYDGGNFIHTNLGWNVPYSNGTISSDEAFGAGGRYFTRKYPGLFVLAADLDRVDSLVIDGDLGAGGLGSTDGAILEASIGGSRYRGFVKRVYHAGNPSVNHLVIVPYDAVISHEFSADTGHDYHRVFGLLGTRRVYYLLYASAQGRYIDNDQTLAILVSFLRAINQAWLGVEPSDGIVPAGGRADLTVTFDATDVDEGAYDATIVIASNDPDETHALVPVGMHVYRVPDIVVAPGALDFGVVYLGFPEVLALNVANVGIEPLEVRSVTSGDPAVTVDVPSFTVAPGASRDVLVVANPREARAIATTLSIASDDPDEGIVEVDVAGVALIPPDIDLDPVVIEAKSLVGRATTRTLTVSNTGGSDLAWRIDVPSNATAGGRVPPTSPAPRGPSALSFAEPRGGPTEPRFSDGARVLIVQDVPPWGSGANQVVLALNGLAFDIANASALATIDLAPYRLLIVASDQTNATYAALAASMGRVADWVSRGGVLEFHGAAWGWYGGDVSVVTLPGGATIVFGFSFQNVVVAPGHPLVAGIPSPFDGWPASQGQLTNLPAGTQVITVDDTGAPTLVSYVHGSGRVVSSTQPLEWSYFTSFPMGQILANLIPWAFNPPVHWLSLSAVSGVLAAGESTTIELGLDAGALTAGHYLQVLTVASDDPDEGTLRSEVRYEVVRLAAEAGDYPGRECSGGGVATVNLDGSGSEHVDGPGAITRYAWSEDGVDLGEGPLLSVPFPVGDHEVTLRIEDASGAQSVDDAQIVIVDTASPVGRITSPASGSCAGPATLPVVVADDFIDVCDGEVVRAYDPPTGPSVTAHGDHVVTLTASDTHGNRASPAVVAFTIDTVPPDVAILVDGPTFEFRKVAPFAEFFASDDADGASGGVVHERITIDDCVLFDGLTFGDGDGLLSDEVVGRADVTQCFLAERCGRRRWTDPVLAVTATDCGGNASRATMTVYGNFVARDCASTTRLTLDADRPGTRLAWSGVQGAEGYQLVRGSLTALRLSGGLFRGATDGCLGATIPGTAFEESAAPTSGNGFWYLVRDVTEGIRASWDEPAGRQVGSRDDGIAVSGGACP